MRQSSRAVASDSITVATSTTGTHRRSQLTRVVGLAAHIDNELDRVAWRVGAASYRQECVQYVGGWIATGVAVSDDGEPMIFVASLPRESREQAEGELLGRLFQVLAAR